MGWTDRAAGWFRGNRSHQAIAGGIALALVAAAVVVPLTVVGGEKALTTVPPGSCGAAQEIRPPALRASSRWQRLSLPPAADCLRLTATKSDRAGVATDTAFVLAAALDLDAGTLAERLVVRPRVRVRVEEETGAAALGRGPSAAKSPTPKRFRIVPESPLAEDTLYRVTLLDRPRGRAVRTWAFQSQGTLRIVGTLPADQSTDVPLNVGIEITFSHDGVSGAEERIEIRPAVEGRFETHKRTVVFVPKSLRRETLYAVTLRAGAAIPGTDQRIARDLTFRFETGSAQRDGETISGQPPMQFSHAVWESPVREAPALGVFSLTERPPSRLGVVVSRFPGVDEFLSSLDTLTAIPAWARLARAGFAPSVDDLDRVASFDAEVRKAGQFGELFVLFPESLPAGFYLVQARAGGRPLHAWLQVTDVATYASVSARRTLVWVNDLATKAAAPGATVRIAGGDFSTTTGSDGVAFFDTPDELLRLKADPLGERAEAVRNLIVTTGTRTAVVPLADVLEGFTSFEFRDQVFPGDPSLYWRFLYTDRHLYRPTDTVSFWGLVRRREGALEEERVTVEITGQTEESGPVLVARTQVSTNDVGTFIGTLPLKGTSPGFYSLEAKAGDRTVAATYLEVRDFATPAYKIDVAAVRAAVFAGDTMRFAVTTSFFEGTPVPNVRLKFAGPESGRLTTDEAGRASLSRRARFDGEVGAFSYTSYEVTPVRPEEGEIDGAAGVQVFAGAIALEATGNQRAGAATIRGTAYAVDLDRINAGKGSDFGDFRGGPSADRTVTAAVVETSYKRVEEGEYYDFVAKAVRKQYRYEPVERPHGTFTAKTDRQGRFTIAFPADDGKTYVAKLRVADDAGRTVREDVFVSSPFDFIGDVPSLSLDGPGPFAVGAPVALTMRSGAKPLPTGGSNRYLFTLAQRGLRSYSAAPAPRYTFQFAAEHVPNVEVTSVRFTGRLYQEVPEPRSIDFDESLRKLTVTVTPERASYRPGEKAVLGVRVTDAAGNPVEAEVLLSAVDEAIFRLQGPDFFGDLDILESLYQPVPSGVLRTYASHRQTALSAGAERGGEGGARDDFRDLALFSRVRTGGDGRGSATFALPDNLTSWRISALAVTKDIRAGSSATLLPVGLPLFADAAMNTSYLETDRPVLRLRAFGTALKSGDAVSFQVSSPTLLARPLAATGTAFTGVDVPLPALREGIHKVTVRVRAGDLTDALVRTVTVVPSRLVRAATTLDEVAAGRAWRPRGATDGVTRVTLTDHNRGRYYPALEELAYTDGDRVDQMLARNLAQELLLENFKEPALLPAVFRASAYQRDDGGIAILPFASSELALSARVAALAADRFGRQELARYFRLIRDDPEETRERAIIALYGLASLGDLVLGDVQRASRAGNLKPRERLYAALAAAEAGDQDTAARLYRGLLEQFGEQRGEAVRLNVGADQDDVLEATALAAILGAQLADGLAPALETYVDANAARDLVLALDRISFLAEALSRLPADPVRFSYAFGGKRVDESLERGESTSLLLAPEELAALDLRVASGSLGAATSFLAPFEAGDVRADPALSIDRAYAGGTTIGDEDLVRISLDYGLGTRAVDGCYRVTDLLPSGLKPVTRPFARGIEDSGIDFPYLVEGQRVSFCAFRQGTQRPIVYYARVIGKGSYTAEAAVLQAQRAQESIALSRAFRVEIR